MGVIGWIFAALGAIVVATLSRLCSDEFKAWQPWITDWLINRAVRLLPDELRERFSEEWRSHIEETPGDLGKLFTAFGFVLASKKIRNGPSILRKAAVAFKETTARKAKRRDFRGEITHLSATWINTIASGIVVAGSFGSLIAYYVGSSAGITANKIIVITVCCVALGATLHLLARALLNRK